MSNLHLSIFTGYRCFTITEKEKNKLGKQISRFTSKNYMNKHEL